MKRRPYVIWTLIGVLIAAGIGIALKQATGLTPGWSYVVAINTATLLIYLADKWLASREGAPRVPNAVLVLLALVGGSAGAILGVATGHKTSRRYLWLRILLWVFLVGHLALLLYARIRPSAPPTTLRGPPVNVVQASPPLRASAPGANSISASPATSHHIA